MKKISKATFGLGDEAGSHIDQFFKVVALVILLILNLKVWGF
jgi:hypothetical protein